MLPLSARLTPDTVPLTAFMLGVQSWPEILGLVIGTGCRLGLTLHRMTAEHAKTALRRVEVQ